MSFNYKAAKEGQFYFSFDTTLYPFEAQIKKIFDVTCNAEDIHLLLPESKHLDQVTFENDTSTLFHQKYYKSPYYREMIEIYTRFIKDHIVPLFPEETFLVVQREPSFRICFPNNTALGKREHETSDEIIGLHCDGDYGHPTEELNFMISITGQHDTNSCYIESSPGKGDFAPLQIKKGQFVSFNGNQCRHYNKKNVEGKTRISFDFRVIPGSLYKESSNVAVHSKKKFSTDSYYTVFNQQ